MIIIIVLLYKTETKIERFTFIISLKMDRETNRWDDTVYSWDPVFDCMMYKFNDIFIDYE